MVLVQSNRDNMFLCFVSTNIIKLFMEQTHQQSQEFHQELRSNQDQVQKPPFTQPEPSFLDIYDHNLDRCVQKLSLKRVHPHQEIFINLHQRQTILLKAISRVGFTNLIRLEITNWPSLCTLEMFGYLEAPCLEQIKIENCASVVSLAGLKKAQSDNLTLINLDNPSQTSSIESLHRVKLSGFFPQISVLNFRTNPQFINLNFLMKLELQNQIEPEGRLTAILSHIRKICIQMGEKFGQNWGSKESVLEIQIKLLSKRFT